MKHLPFEIEPTNHGCRYQLPARDLSELTRYGWILIGAGSLGCLFMIGWMSGPAIMGLQILNQNPAFAIAIFGFSAFGLFGLSHTLKILMGGICLLKNQLRCEVEIRGKYIHSTEILGWFSWRRRRKINRIKKLEMIKANSKKRETGNLGLFSKLEKLLTISAQDDGKQNNFLIAPGYDATILEPLTHELAHQLNKLQQPVLVSHFNEPELSTPNVTVDTIVQDQESESDEFVFEQPVNSKVEVVDSEGTTTYRVPPVGIKGIRGLFTFSLFWLAFVSVFVVMIGADMINNGFRQDVLIGSGVISLFAMAGVALLVFSLNTARRSAMIGVRDNLLFIERKSIFGTQWLEFEREQITQISKGPSGTKVNDVPIMELQIFDQNGKKHGLLSQLDDDELGWLAHQLNQQLELNTTTGILTHAITNARSDTNWPQPPTNSNIVLTEMEERSKKILVPARGIFSAVWALIGAGITLVVGLGVAGYLLVGMGEIFGGLMFGLIGGGIGGTIFIISLIYACRRFEFKAQPEELIVVRTGLFGQQKFRFDRKSISQIEISSSDWKHNDRRLLQLSIISSETNLNVMLDHQLHNQSFVAAHLQDWQNQS